MWYCRNCKSAFPSPTHTGGYVGCDMDGNRGEYEEGNNCPYCGSYKIDEYKESYELADYLIEELMATFDCEDIIDIASYLLRHEKEVWRGDYKVENEYK